MNQFERKKIKENKASKDTWCDWLVNYIPEAEKKKRLGGFKGNAQFV